jgi:hypothetical protein
MKTMITAIGFIGGTIVCVGAFVLGAFCGHLMDEDYNRRHGTEAE